MRIAESPAAGGEERIGWYEIWIGLASRDGNHGFSPPLVDGKKMRLLGSSLLRFRRFDSSNASSRERNAQPESSVDPSPAMSVCTSDDEETLYVRCDRIGHYEVARQAGSELRRLLRSQPQPTLKVDLRETESLSSETLNQLITTLRLARERGTRLVLCNLSPPLQEVFHNTRLDRIFELEPVGSEHPKESETL